MSQKDMVPAIEVEGLRKVYHHIVAVDDVSFVMYRGEAFGFLGPNGAGKAMDPLPTPTARPPATRSRPYDELHADR